MVLGLGPPRKVSQQYSSIGWTFEFTALQGNSQGSENFGEQECLSISQGIYIFGTVDLNVLGLKV